MAENIARLAMVHPPPPRLHHRTRWNRDTRTHPYPPPRTSPSSATASPSSATRSFHHTHARVAPVWLAIVHSFLASCSQPPLTALSSMLPRPHFHAHNTLTSLAVVCLDLIVILSSPHLPNLHVLLSCAQHPNLSHYCMCLLNLIVVCPTSSFPTVHVPYPNLARRHPWFLPSLSSSPTTISSSSAVSSSLPS
jgi:hypothetical protein